MSGKSQSDESVVIRSLRHFREKYFNARKNVSDQAHAAEVTSEDAPPGFLDCLPVDLQFLIMTLLSPVDLCRLGATSSYWRAMVRDPLLWRYFLVRDMPKWSTINHVTMPRLEALHTPLCGGEKEMEEPGHDFMTDYLKGYPACRQQWFPQRPPYSVVTSFLQSLVPTATEPRYAMFGPGMEQLDVSMVTKLMHTPDVLLVAGIPQRQINGIGSGISYVYKNQHKFNILTLYSTNRAERERARMEQQSVSNKLFIQEGRDQSGHPHFSPTPQVQEVCQAVDGFIYVANAEPGRGDDGEVEWAQIQALVDPALGSSSRPLLVLSCVSREEPDQIRTTSSNSTRTPCVDMAQRLCLPMLPNPWMVQDTVAESLSGVLDGISWLLGCSGLRL
ncbi:F-box only protein 4 [Oncorhynchus keta]|uniref:F-box only protein 4 n=1 Tax=Oncorhynchus keta TaxID=8018 RepID=UPI0015FC94CE|nr:F-box only protein 4 [Oncorhynchus keta]